MKIIFWNEQEIVIWNEIEIVRINMNQMNKKKCSRSVPIRNVSLHREEHDGIQVNSNFAGKKWRFPES